MKLSWKLYQCLQIMDKKHVIEKVNNSFQDTMMSVLGIEITDFGDNYISGKMPVDTRTKQPFGLLHGGASAAFAETLGSIGAGKHVDLEEYSVVGPAIELSENPGKIKHRSPELGEHNQQILMELGYTQDEINQLKKDRII